MFMVYHGILWESMGNFSILLTVLGMFYCYSAVPQAIRQLAKNKIFV